MMIEVQSVRPKNGERFSRLLEFYREVVTICSDLGVAPVLNGSLAVFGYTKNQAMKVNDIDLACSELEFPRIIHALTANDIAYALKDWHVLQVLRDDLKVEFDSMEYWMKDLPDEHDTLVVGGYSFKVIGLPSLKELYRRGLEATANQNDEIGRAKYAAFKEKYEALCLVKERVASISDGFDESQRE